MGRRLALAFALFVLLPVTTAAACLWDVDTIATERSQFPGVAELIVGQFPRHSEEFYAWRVEDRQQRLQAAPDDLALMDDLAVALDKLGRHAEAIAVMERAAAIDPDRYETLSNLGTLHMHAGELETGLHYIDRALEVNPDAHFGRERVQAQLVRYVLQRGLTARPLDTSERMFHKRDVEVVRGFARYVLDEAGGEFDEALLRHSLQGVLGMMRFGDYRSPVLLEAAGDLMIALPGDSAPRQLVAWAYVRAGDMVDDAQAREAYRELASFVLAWVPGDHDELAQVDYELNWELSNANAWFATLCERELEWIADPSVDPDAAFAAAYLAPPAVADDDDAPDEPAPSQSWKWLFALPIIGGVLVITVGRSTAMA